MNLSKRTPLRPGCRISLFLLATLCCVQVLGAVGVAGPRHRNLQFDHLTTDSGLSQDMINDIAQDRRGFIWIATQEGLNRYDGYELHHYENIRSDPHSLSNDFVHTLLVDRQGVLWAGTKNGLDRYDEVNDRFEPQHIVSSDGEALTGSDVRAIMQTHDGAYWIGTERSGLLRIDVSGEVQRFRHDPADATSLPDDAVVSLFEDSIGNIWIGAGSAGLSRYDPVTNRFVRYHHSVDPAQEVPGDEIKAIYEDRSGILWIGTGGSGLTRFDLKRGKVEHFLHDQKDPTSIPDDRVHSIVEDPRGTIWVATGKGLAEWRTVEGFVTYVHESNDQRSLVNEGVNKLFVDASGVLWVATIDGVSRWNYFSDPFSYFRVEDGSLSGNVVTSMAESGSGILWVASYGAGLTRIDQASGHVRIFRASPQDPAALPSDDLMAVHVDEQGRVWVGTRGHGIAMLEEDEQSFLRFEHEQGNPASLSSNKVSSIITDSVGNLWVGTFGGGLNRMTAGQLGVFEHFRHDERDPTSLSGDRVIRLYEDRAGRLWVSMDGAGLNRFDAESGSFSRFQAFEVSGTEVVTEAGTSSQSMTLDIAMDLMEDRDGSLWIGTLGQGLWRWNADERRQGHAYVDVFGKMEGLPSDTIYGVLEEGSGALWFSSNRGLTRFDMKGGIRVFDSRNGLIDREFMPGARLRSASGKLMFGGVTGLVGYFPGDLPVNEHPPRVVVEARSRDAALASTVSGDPRPQVEVGYPDRFLSFDFVALDFTSPDKNQYRYRLDGFDSDWVEADDFRRAIYTNLTPGKYTFSVEGTNNDGLWNVEPAVIEVVVVPAPWATWWAYLVYFSIVAILVGFYLRAQRGRMQVQSKQREMLEVKVIARTQELAQQNEKLESLNQQLAEASVTDSLTGLKNRRYFDQYVTSEGAELARKLGVRERSSDESNRAQILFFMMIDLDDFKLINDRFGHQAGDTVLIQVKDVLEASCRETDVLIRWGGDEFMIIGMATSLTAAKLLAERVRAAVADLVYDGGGGAVGLLSASIGVASYALNADREPLNSWEQVVAIADRAAYISKTNGRNAWVSLDGAQDLDAEELDDFSDSLEMLVAAGKISVDSSLRSPPVLANLREAQRRESAG